MTRHFRFQYRSSFGVRSGKMTMTMMVSVVVTTVKLVVAVVILKLSKILGVIS
jgi:hypothetical protein